MRNAIAILLLTVAAVLAAVYLMPEDGAQPCQVQTFEGSRFTVCAFSPIKHEVTLAWADTRGQALRGFEALAASGAVEPGRVRFAMNAGMYDPSGAPIGLFVAEGRETHPLNRQTGNGNFYMQPNGVFGVRANGEAFVMTTDAYANGGEQPVWATQSGPMLVVEGKLNASFGDDGPSRHVRNGVGVQSPALTLFVISEEPVSFGRFARFFRDALKCEQALYLDGSVSSLWEPASGRRDDGYALGPMVVISNRIKGPVSAGVAARRS